LEGVFEAIICRTKLATGESCLTLRELRQNKEMKINENLLD
jgi:hypothetical protein